VAVADVPFKERQRRAREEAILDATAEVLVECGFHEMSMDDIAARVGIAKGTIYLHFSSKDALVAALVARGIEDVNALIAELDPAQPVLTRLGRVLRELLWRQEREWRVMRDEFQELRRIIAADECCTQLARRLRELLVTLIDEGKRRGEVDPHLHTGAAVGAFFALLSSRCSDRMLAGGDITLRELSASIVRLYLRGIAADRAVIPLSRESQ
jgi:AcrR family transcriptional regulator